jgi:hypothetical protein
MRTIHSHGLTNSRSFSTSHDRVPTSTDSSDSTQSIFKPKQSSHLPKPVPSHTCICFVASRVHEGETHKLCESQTQQPLLYYKNTLCL